MDENILANIISQSIYRYVQTSFLVIADPNRFYRGRMSVPSIISLFIVLVAMLFIAGCTTVPVSEKQTVITTPAFGTQSPVVTPTPQSKAFYTVTIAQRVGSNSELIKMETDVYNPGEVIDFFLNSREQLLPTCEGGIFSFRIFSKTNNGSWEELQGPFRAYLHPSSPCPAVTNAVCQQPLPPEYRFVTTGWTPGYYKIQSDCLNASHEFILRNISSAHNTFSS